MKVIVIVGCLLACSAICFAQTTHYLDCGAPNKVGDSLRPESAWNSIDQVGRFVFQPGDRLLLRRGSRCEGMLAPKGSGTAKAPIMIGAYGEGSLPVIAGGKQKAGLQLMNQDYWEIENLEILGGSPYGLHIGADRVSIRYFRLRNLLIHSVMGEPTTKESGLLVVAPAPKSPATISDVIVDGVTVYDTTEWGGIIVTGAIYNEQKHRYGEQILIRNSIVHDVAGDGILLASARHGVIEHNVAWNTGMQDTQTIGTPNAIWEWMCVDCRVAWNEGFFSDSPGVDGGVFDIDYGNIDNIVEHNFGHDSQGYCAAIFAAEGRAGDSTNNVIRDNVCLHNGRSPRLARRQGAIFVDTWHGGRLNGIEIERNTILWDPPLDAPAIHAHGEFSGTLANKIENNRILLVTGSAMDAPPTIPILANLVCTSKNQDEAQANSSGQRTQGLCGCWTDWRNQFVDKTQITLPPQIAELGKGWRLFATFSPGDSSGESRARVVLVESMTHQFESKGLRGVLWPESPLSKGEAEQLRESWHVDPLIDIAHGAQIPASQSAAQMDFFLLKPDGTLAASWHAPVDAALVWLELEHRLGTPPGMQSTPFCRGKE